VNYKIKKTISTILLITSLSLPLFAKADLVSDLQQQISDKQNQIKEMEQRVSQLKNSIRNTKTQQSTLNKQIDSYEQQIDMLQSDIDLTYAKIGETNLQIQRINANIKTKESELETNKTYLVSAIRTMNEHDQETPFEIVLKNDNFSDFLDQVQYMDDLQKEIQTRINTIKQIKDDLNAQESDQENYKGALLSLNEDLQGKTLALSFQKSDKQDLLSVTKNQEKKYQSQVQGLQEQQEDIEKQISDLESKLRQAIDPSSIPTAGKGVLSWPINSAITQGYGSTSVTGFINNVYNFHNGIDLRASIGTPIKAAADGVVAGVGNDGKYAYGKWIAINHQNGLITLYGHFSVQSVSAGQHVTRGQVIGYSGNTGFATGPHLHFTVYDATTFSIVKEWYGSLPLGGSLNPMNYLP
jgi:murein DD-endopeptidase MepM/ murein hydrolase activator NlpD